MSVDKKVYRKSFYGGLSAGEDSAKVIYSLVEEILPKFSSSAKSDIRVCDIGCGNGSWLKVFKSHGCKVFGIDGNPYFDTLLLQPDEFMQHDFREPLEIDDKFDLTLCIEVAEHLPESMADDFVKLLASTSDIILFSAAIPCQGGTDHVNEQWQSYWARKFEKLNYITCDCIRPLIWNNELVTFYYRQNMLLYVRNNDKNKGLIEKYQNYHIWDTVQWDREIDIIHPGYFKNIAAMRNSFSWKMIMAMAANPIIYRLVKVLKFLFFREK